MKFLTYMRDLLFPPKCACCNKLRERNEIFCKECISEIPFIEFFHCEKCGIELSSEFPGTICARCRERKFKFDKNIPLIEYKGFGRKTVLNLKYNNYSEIRGISILLAQKIMKYVKSVDIVTCVPEMKKDSYEKALKGKISLPKVMAEYVAKTMDAPFKEIIVKIKRTKKQKELTTNQRIINVRGAYHVVESCRDKRLLLIDDVFTTGATMDECSRILKRAGAKEVICATLGIRDRE